MEVIIAYLLEKRRSALPIPKKKDDHGHLPIFPQWRVVKVAMAYAIIFQMAIFSLSSVGSCGGGHGLSSREEEVCTSYT